MRIGLFTESYEPVINGVSTSVKTLALELLAEGHEPTVLAPRYPGYADNTDVPVRRMPSWVSPWNPENPFAHSPLLGQPMVLRNLPLDVVHTQQPFGMGHHGLRLARQLEVPLVSTFHTLYHEYTHYVPLPSAVSSWWLSRHLRLYYGHACTRVIVPSRATGEVLIRLGVPEEKLTVVPTGIPALRPVLASEVAAVRQRYSLPELAPVLLYVGRIAREKNIELLFEALRQWPSDAILLLVGGGPALESLKSEAEARGLATRIRFAGFVPRIDLPPIFAAATLFVFPSITDTQGVVLSEAQSNGLPCVVARGGGAPEFVRDGIDALIVPPQELGAATAALLADRDRLQAFACAARQSPLHPTPTEMARRIVEVYEAARMVK
jgi:1,2-diacylglycerol 3-alpha-glucosyltransferase